MIGIATEGRSQAGLIVKGSGLGGDYTSGINSGNLLDFAFRYGGAEAAFDL